LGRLTLKSGSRVYLDTAPIIYTTERHSEYSQVLAPLWQLAKLRQVKIVTSELTILETLVLPIRRDDEELIATYDDLFTNSATRLFPISKEILREAAHLRATLNFKTPDAIHAATAITSSCDHLVANDNGFRRLTNIDVIILDDLVAE